jgi:hypothetical protein
MRRTFVFTIVSVALLILIVCGGEAFGKKKNGVFTYKEKPRFQIRKPSKDWEFIDVDAEKQERIRRIDQRIENLTNYRKKLEAQKNDPKAQEEIKKVDQDLATLKKQREQAAAGNVKFRMVKTAKGGFSDVQGLDGKPLPNWAKVTKGGKEIKFNVKMSGKDGLTFRSKAKQIDFALYVQGGFHAQYIYVGSDNWHPETRPFTLSNPKGKAPTSGPNPYGIPGSVHAGIGLAYALWKDKEKDLWTLMWIRNGSEFQFEGTISVPGEAICDVFIITVKDKRVKLKNLEENIKKDLKEKHSDHKMMPSAPFQHPGAGGAKGLRMMYMLTPKESDEEWTYQLYLFKKGFLILEMRFVSTTEDFKKDKKLKRDVAKVLKKLRIAW